MSMNAATSDDERRDERHQQADGQRWTHESSC